MTKTHGSDRLWLNFRCITNDAWYRDNLVLMGDAAHTTHFSIGSGTKLAIEDAVTLADKLTEHDALAGALRAYQEQRTAALFTIQQDEHSSTRWFENVPRYMGQDAVEFAYSLWQRRGRHPIWRHQLHRASQVAPVRRLRKSVGTARRYLHARRRTKLAGGRQLAAPAAPAHQ
jgi:flavin-dependent dehydrogenase